MDSLRTVGILRPYSACVGSSLQLAGCRRAVAQPRSLLSLQTCKAVACPWPSALQLRSASSPGAGSVPAQTSPALCLQVLCSLLEFTFSAFSLPESGSKA